MDLVKYGISLYNNHLRENVMVCFSKEKRIGIIYHAFGFTISILGESWLLRSNVKFQFVICLFKMLG